MNRVQYAFFCFAVMVIYWCINFEIKMAVNSLERIEDRLINLEYRLKLKEGHR